MADADAAFYTLHQEFNGFLSDEIQRLNNAGNLFWTKLSQNGSVVTDNGDILRHAESVFQGEMEETQRVVIRREKTIDFRMEPELFYNSDLFEGIKIGHK